MIKTSLTHRVATLAFAAGLLLAVGCGDDDDGAGAPLIQYEPPVWPDAIYTTATGTPQEQIDRFVAANDMDTTVTASGLVYEIFEPGSGEMPSSDDTVRVFYRGYFVDGRVFDQTSSQPLRLFLGPGQVIDAWNEALPLLAVDGQIRIVVRPRLGYGEVGRNTNVGPITAESVIVFDIELADLP